MLEVTIPQIGESITTVFISQWLKQPGDAVAEGESLLELDSDKASMELPAPAAGILVEQLAAEGDEVPIGALIARLDPSGEVPVVAKTVAPATDRVADAEVRAGPAARRKAGQKGVDLAGVQGSGPRGRIVSGDVAQPNAGGVSSLPVDRTVESDGRTERVRMSPLRQTIGRRLVEAQHTAAILTTFNEVDMTAVMALRKQYQERFVAAHGIKLGFMSFFVKAVIDGLKEFPAVNAEVDGSDVLYKSYYNIGVAVSGPKGLVVPVLRDADQLSFAEVEQGIAGLAGRARDNKLALADFKDGTFTVSNGGVFGSMLSTPILNPPQVGILGMHNIIQRPVGVEGRIELRPMMYLALSYDHRIIDGREAVQFLVRVKECIEAPDRILYEV
jgi:2-oxoglutarate dehydrogenase E2 component (dihydrolipoamide succinyltransferase)